MVAKQVQLKDIAPTLHPISQLSYASFSLNKRLSTAFTHPLQYPSNAERGPFWPSARVEQSDAVKKTKKSCPYFVIAKGARINFKEGSNWNGNE